MKVCCVIPAYQESRAIEQVVHKSQRYCDRVIVVDDGSTDGTGSIAAATGALVLSHPRNLGKGAALRTGLGKALNLACPVTITLDGDGQHDPRSIPRFVQAIQEKDADVVVGSRYATLAEAMPFARKLSNLMTTKALRLLYGVPVTDSQSGYRAFTKRVLRTIRVRSNGFAAETEMLIDAKRAGFKIAEVPVATSYGEEKSKIRALRDIARWVLTLIRNLLYRPRFLSQNE
jgi:glycosyltransferase involved in cell wall biosynthesis